MAHPVQIRRKHPEGEEGFLLVGLVVACFLILLVLGIAAPRVAKELERDREVESQHRALEYVRAIQLYYRRNNAYPSSVDQLLGTGTASGGISAANQVRYLRQRYKDPLTNDEYRLIPMGQAQTQVKGFFGEPLEGMPVGNLGSVAGMSSGIGGAGAVGGSTPGSALNGNTSGSGLGSSGFSLGGTTPGSSGMGSSGLGTAGAGTAGTGTTGTGAGTGTAGTTGTGTGPASTDATTFQGSKGMFVGVGSNAKGHGLIEWNGSENIEQWEFLYDPRVELLKARVSLFGGTPAASGTGSLGSGFTPASGATGLGAGGLGGSTGTSTGGFGSGGFGSGSGTTSGTGTVNTPASGTPATTPVQ